MGKIKDLITRVDEVASDYVIDMDDEIRTFIEDQRENYSGMFESQIEMIAEDLGLEMDDVHEILEQDLHDIFYEAILSESEY